MMGQVVKPHKTGAGNFACAVCLNIFRFPALQAAMYRLTNPAYRQPVFGGDRVGRFMSD